MNTTQVQDTSQPDTSGGPKSLKIKHIGVSALYRAAELLGGNATRSTGGHNYIVYRFPNGKQVHLPPIKGGTGKPINRGVLQPILRQFIDAGVPHPLLEQTLDFVGATWWTPPTPSKELHEHLATKPTITSTDQWHEMNSLITPTPRESPANDTSTETSPVMRSLRQAAIMRIPIPRNEKFLKETLQQIRAKFENGDEAYQQLIIDQAVDTQLNGDAFKFLLNQYASEIIAKDALEIYTTKRLEASLPPAPNGHHWSGISLRDAIQLDLPAEAAARHASKLVRLLRRKLSSQDEPFASLKRQGHVIQRETSNLHPQGFAFTDHAASVLAQEAKNAYEAKYKPPGNHHVQSDARGDHSTRPA